MARGVYVAIVAAVAALVVGQASAYHCACYLNQADHSYEGVMCTSMYVPSSLLGWGRPVNTWFSVDCSDCSVDYNCTRAENPRDAKLRAVAPPATAPPVEDAVEDLGFNDAGDPVKCCAYAKKIHYYTDGIHADAMNPKSGGECVGQEYGAVLIGEWYVTSMFDNQCYFIVGQKEQ